MDVFILGYLLVELNVQVLFVWVMPLSDNQNRS